MVAHALTVPGIGRVVAGTMAVNTRSRRVLEKVGLVHVRTWHEEFDDPLPGTEQGEVGYELSREQWAARART
jgi:RimJ/RimL family protein N-acetyltransferase